MADVAILAQGVQVAPNGYTVPGGQEILLKSIRVSYNGVGAGGSFLPVLQLVAPGQSNTVVAEYPISSTLAAGASADVTWFPGMNAKTEGASMSYAPAIGSIATSTVFNADFGDPAHAGRPDTGSLLFDFSGGYNFPAALRSGVYTVAWWVSSQRAVNGDLPGEYADIGTEIAVNTDDVLTRGNVPLGYAAHAPAVALPLAGNVTTSYEVSAGDTFQAFVKHSHGSNLSFLGQLDVSVVYT